MELKHDRERTAARELNLFFDRAHNKGPNHLTAEDWFGAVHAWNTLYARRMRREVLLNKIQGGTWDDLPTEVLEKAAALLDSPV